MKKIVLPLFTSRKGMAISLLDTLYSVKNKFQDVKIIDTKEFGRSLLIDGVMQGTESDHHIYDNELLKYLSKEDKKILILGGGDGFVANSILKRHPGVVSIEIVDIDKDVVVSCERFFSREKDFSSKVNFIIDDAVSFLENLESQIKYSAIIFDLTEIPIAGDESVKQFFEKLLDLISSRIVENGWISIQAGTPKVTEDFFDLNTCLLKLFKSRYEYIESHSKFIPSFGEEAAFMSIRLKRKYLYDLGDEVLSSNASLLGGKGYSLHEMIKHGIVVPKAFVVSSLVFDRFLVENNLTLPLNELLKKVHYADQEEIHGISKEVIKLLVSAKLPLDIEVEIKNVFLEKKFKHVSVRSSATMEDGIDNAWAGQLETFLNVEIDNVAEKVIHCFASLFSERALTYKREHALEDKDAKVAVVVQEMINASVSGVAFSVNPLNNTEGEVVIESIFGLGELLVGGRITPDNYVINKDTLRISAAHKVRQTVVLGLDEKGGVSEKEVVDNPLPIEKMSDAKYIDLAKIVIECENYFKSPQDVEWCLKGEELFILQSRPITTVANGTIPDFRKYKKIYTVENIFPPLFIDLAIKSKYLKYNGIFLFDNNTTTLLLSNTGFVLANKVGAKKLLNGDYVTEAKRNYRNVKMNTSKLKKRIKSIKTRTDLKVCFMEYIKIFNLALYEYSFTEYFYSFGAEQKINKQLKKELGSEYYDSLLYELSSGVKKKNIALSARTKKQILNLRVAGQEKLLFRGLMNDLAVLYGGFISMFHKFYNTSDDFFDYLFIDEAVALLGGVEDLSELKKRIKLREEFYVLCFDGKKIKKYESLEAENIINYYKKIEKSSAGGDSFVGRGVFSGYYRGVVKKVPYFMDTSDKGFRKYIQSFNQGDVLLARSTGPELLPVIKKAGAIIAEEGGIMSHAAVVCREFKKPGVVGIPNIFESLSDGDVVFVDGQTGMVVVEEQNTKINLSKSAHRRRN